MRALLSSFFITLRGNNLENISLIEVWNHAGVCEHIDWRLQVSCSGLREFAVPNSNDIILKANTFFSVFCPIEGIYIKFKTFWKKMIVIVNVFPKSQTVKDLITPLSEKRCFRISFESEHVKGSQTLVKSAWDLFYHIFPSLWREIIFKISPLLKFEITAIFVNTLTAYYKYPVQDFENLPFPFKCRYLKKGNIFRLFCSIDGIYIIF